MKEMIHWLKFTNIQLLAAFFLVCFIPKDKTIAQTPVLQMFTKEAKLDEHIFELNSVMGSGVAFFDYNNDNLEDVYLTGGIFTDGLFKNLGDGTFENVTRQANISHIPIIQTLGVTTGDIDNDGFRDIFISTNHDFNNILYHNNGDETFTEITHTSGITETWNGQTTKHRSFSPTFGDVNLDGYLDIYVSNWVDSNSLHRDSLGNFIKYDPYGAPNFLYLNNGDLTFTEVSNQYGVIGNGCTLASIFSDYDNDRDLDLLVTNDFGLWGKPDELYRNDFPNLPLIDEGKNSGYDSKLYGMGIGVGDYDRDGDLDYYKTSIGAAVLLQNRNNGTFEEVAEHAGVQDVYINGVPPDWSIHWGARFTDLDLDGHLELVVAKGRVGLGSLPHTTVDSMPDKIWHNLGDGTFEDVTHWFDVANRLFGRGLACSDYDNDGDIDLLFSNSMGITLDGQMQMDGIPAFYKNNLTGDGNWLKIKPEGTVNNRDGFGTHFTIFVDGESWLHEVGGGGGGHNSQSSSIAHFGLGDASVVDSLLVSWPGNLTPEQMFYDIPRNHFLKIIEGEDEWEVIQGDSTNNDTTSVSVLELSSTDLSISVFPNPVSEGNFSIRFSNNKNRAKDSAVLKIFNSLGTLVKTEKISLLATTSVETKDFSPGIYHLNIETGGRLLTERLIVH